MPIDVHITTLGLHEQNILDHSRNGPWKSMPSLVSAPCKPHKECHIQHLSHANAVHWVHLENVALWSELCLDSDVFCPIRSIELPSPK